MTRRAMQVVEPKGKTLKSALRAPILKIKNVLGRCPHTPRVVAPVQHLRREIVSGAAIMNARRRFIAGVSTSVFLSFVSCAEVD
ncbi:MAG: hypothetical protein KGO50_12375, partial [Myxococcales bacterium]|nr:hypothetical protein [Myxococcales bacterium]